MAGVIGAIDVDIAGGRPPTLKTRLYIWQTPGIDGYGAMALGAGDAVEERSVVLFADSNADANSFIAACEALQGTTISITDDFGDTWNSYLVTHVDTDKCKKAVVYQGNPLAMRVEIKLSLVAIAS